MRYSYEFKLMCVDLYKSGRYPDTPNDTTPERFRKNVREWSRMVDSNGPEVLKHKVFNKVWSPEEKLELVSQVIAGKSRTDIALKAGINPGMLYQWVQKYKTTNPKPLTESEREELIRLRAENEYIKAENEVIKKGYQLKYLLKAMHMAKSTYYFEIGKKDVVAERNQKMLEEIKNIFELNKRRYGVRRVHQELINRGYKVNHKRVQRLMHEAGLVGKRPKEKYHSYKGEVGKIADNIIDRDFSTTAPLQKWTTDVSQFSFAWANAIYLRF